MFRSVLIAVCILACSCGEYVSLSKVQGKDELSPLKDQFVRTKGVVSGVYQDKGQLGGFYLEHENTFSKSGIFVKSKQKVNLGDEIFITAKVVEYKNETRLDSVQNIEVLSSGNTLVPKEIYFPISKNKLERLEGSLISIQNELLISNSYSFLKYGQLLLSSSELIQATENYDAQNDSLLIQGILHSNTLNSIIVDDLSNKRFPQVDSLYCNTNEVIVGNKCYGVIGYVSQHNEDYKIRLIDKLAIKPIDKNENSDTDGELKIMSFNLHNLFNGDGLGAGFPTPRGAKTQEAYQIQQIKLGDAISVANPDIIALMELENDGDDSLSTIVQFCDYLNTLNQNRNYIVAQSENSAGTDLIKTGIIYDSKVVTANSQGVYHNHEIFSRAPLFQKFTYSENEFVLSVNHFKSKSPRGAEGLNRDQLDGQASYNYKRVQQAKMLLSIIDSLYTDENLLIVGDFNAYTNEDPIQLLESGDLSRLYIDGYSYEYKGHKGNLDHAFVNHEFLENIKGVKVWDINSSYPNWIDYRHELTDSSRYRSSDHNPILIGVY